MKKFIINFKQVVFGGMILGVIMWGNVQAARLKSGLRLLVSRPELEVGQTLTVTLEFRQVGTSSSSAISQPSIATPKDFDVEFSSTATRIMMINQNLEAISTTRMQWKAIHPGTEILGPALIIYRGPHGKNRELKSNLETVVIHPAHPFSLFGWVHKKTPPKTIAKPMAMPSTQSGPESLKTIKPLLPLSAFWIQLIFWFLVVLVIIGFVARLWKKKHPQSISPSAIQQLVDRFSKLKKSNLEDPAFCLEIASLIRALVQMKYTFSTMDLTTREIQVALSARNVSKVEIQRIEKCLKICDRVLYAEGTLVTKDKQGLFDAVEALLGEMSSGNSRIKLD
jgi:hypothetical protein